MASQGGKPWDEGDEIVHAEKEMVFCSLHHHTTFSYKDGYGTPMQHYARGAEIGLSAIAMVEHGNVTSHVQAEQASAKTGVKAIFGAELYCGEVDELLRTQRKNHLTVLAENDEGYRNLLRVVSRGWAEGYYYEPTVSGAMLREHAEGLIVLSGCSGSLLATSIVGGKNIDEADASYDRGLGVAQRFHRLLGDGYYLEVQAFPELKKTCLINQALARMSEATGIPLVATLDAHYMRPDEVEMQNILHSIRGGNKKSAEDIAKTWSKDVRLCPVTDNVLFRKLVDTGLSRKQAEQAIRNSRVIAERCNVTLPKVTNLQYPLPPEHDHPDTLFRQWINEGWKYRGFNRLPEKDRQTYIDRVKYEMDLIQSKGFTDYFLVVSDAVRFCKDIAYRPPEFQHHPVIPVGPARGSAAASLVCYLLRITEINPMPFPNLLFERFIDANRHDLPDIDLDFDDELRWILRTYLVSKYGAERVGNIGTFTKYKGKNSLEDVQRSMYPDNWQCKEDVETVKGLLIERSSGDLRASGTVEDTIEMFPQVKAIFDKWPDLYKAQLLEGNVRGMSVHAAGLVIANDPLTDVCAVYTRVDADGNVMLDENGDPAQVVSLDKHDAEYLNVMKLDALGLKTMAMIRIALEQFGMTLEELYALPLDDEETLRGFQEGDVVGIFQFDGRAMRSVNAGVIPDNFDEVCDINALARPGPLHSGATAEYIDIKHERKAAMHYHPIVDKITEHTQFQIVYQEQILQVVRLLGNFSWEEAARIRKIISKKRGEQEFNTMRAKFIAGAKTHGMDEADGDRVFSLLATAGAYAFNAAHCVSYGMLAYWTMWIKRNHTVPFYVGALRKCNDDKKGKKRRDQLLRDAISKDIPIGPLSLNQSQRSWSVSDAGELIPGFMQVKGIGEKTTDMILSTREANGRFEEPEDLLEIKGIGPATLEALTSFEGADDPMGLHTLSRSLAAVKGALRGGVLSESVTGDMGMLPVPTHTAGEVPYDREETDTEVVWLGVVRERNLKDLFELHHSRTGEHLDPNKTKDPHLNEWVVLTCEDDTDSLIVTIDRWRYSRFKEAVWEIEPDTDFVLVRGIKKHYQARRAIYVTDLWVLEQEAEDNDSDQ